MKKQKLTLAYPALSGIGLTRENNRVLSFVNSSGEIKLNSSKTKKSLSNLLWIPFLRGIMIFFYGMYEYFYFLSESARFGEIENQKLPAEEKVSKKLGVSSAAIFWFLFTVLVAFAGIFAFNIVPSLIVREIVSVSAVAKNAILGALKVAIFYLFVIILKIIPSFRAYYRFNGAINACKNLENTDATKNATTKSTATSSQNLSTNFLCFVVFCFAIHFFVVSLIGLEANFFLLILFNIGMFAIATSVCYEFLKLFESRKLLVSRIVAAVLCFPVTNKPTRTELEVCLGAQEELDTMTKDKTRIEIDGKDENIALSSVLCETKNILASHDIDDPSEAEWLVATVLGKNRTEMKLTPTISRGELQKIRDAVALRIKHMPLSKIFGFTEFYGMKFYVDKNVLSPRPETELVCEQAINLINSHNFKKVLDLCTGSGAIAITLAKNTKSKVEACDISRSALKVAEKNAKNLGAKVNFFESNMFSGLKKNSKFDIIVSNPPYIATKEIQLLDVEVKNYDPHLSLDGGDDGLDFYRIISENAPTFLKNGGMLVLEIGDGQANAVKKLLSANFKNTKIIKDYNNIQRIVIATAKGATNAGKNQKDKTKI